MSKTQCWGVLLICLAGAAQDAAQAPGVANAKRDYSKEATLVEEFKTEIQFENDGTSTQEEYQRVRVQSDAGVRQLGILTFPYASGTGSLEIEFIRVRKPDGSAVETPANEAQDMASEITRQAPFYSDLRELHIAVKGLSAGDVLEYKVRIHIAKPLTPGQFSAAYSFTRNVIVLKEQLIARVPVDRVIKLNSPGLKPVETVSGAYRTYSWSNSNPAVEEKNQNIATAEALWEASRGRYARPDVELTTFQSWQELGQWFGELQKDRVKVSPEIQAKANELTKGLIDGDARIRAIYNYVSTQFRYIGIAFGVGRYQPHFASEVLANQYGDCKDKHTLLAALLGAAGYKAYPALINSQRQVDADVPMPLDFNHVITVVPRGDKLLWLDSTPEVGPFEYLVSPLRGKSALIVWDDKPASFATTPDAPPFPTTQEFRMEATLDNSGTMVGNAKLSVRGDVEVAFRAAFRSTPMPQWKDLAQRISLGLGFGGEVSDVNASPPEKTDEPFELSYKYKRKEYGDWANRRVLAPSPYVNLPTMSADLNGLKVPFWIGEKVTITFHSRLKLPSDYTVEAPAAVHIKDSFGEYDSTYSSKDGILASERQMRILSNEVAKADFPEYEKFYKTVMDDYQSFIQLSSTRGPAPKPEAVEANQVANAIRGLPESGNTEALRLEEEAESALGSGDVQGAASALYRATAADPKFTRAWVMLGGLLIYSKQKESGIDAFEKAVAADPQNMNVRRVYAHTMAMTKDFEKSAALWQTYIQLAPADPEGPAGLGEALLALKRYPEAARALESAVKIAPDRSRYQWLLGSAYVRSGETEKANALYEQLLTTNPGAEKLNQAAYEMTLSKPTPPVALKYAEDSVRDLEESSMRLDLTNSTGDEETMAVKLAEYWGTLGRVQQRFGDSAAAEKTLTAAWKLTQDGVAAAHLCELYEQEHKYQQALRACRLARNRLAMEKDPEAYDVAALIEENNARLERLKPGSSSNWNTGTVDEIADMRDFKVPYATQGTHTAQFLILAELDPSTEKFKVKDAKFLNGSARLKTAGNALLKLNLNFVSPDGKPVRVVRWGTFLCAQASGCEFVLPDAGAGRSVSIPFPENKPK